jgi:hypothetical protein
VRALFSGVADFFSLMELCLLDEGPIYVRSGWRKDSFWPPKNKNHLLLLERAPKLTPSSMILCLVLILPELLHTQHALLLHLACARNLPSLSVF